MTKNLDWEKLLAGFEGSSVGVMLVDDNIPFEVREDVEGNPVAVIDATCEFVNDLPESPIVMISLEQTLGC